MTITLDEPLGDRTIVDASTLPPQPIAVEAAPPPTAGVDPALIETALAYEPPASYVMDVDVSCFCPAARYRVTVVDGEKAEVQLVDPDGDEVTDEPVPNPDAAPTIAELQDRLRETVDGGGVVRELSVDDDGRPVVVSLDPIVDAVDDEVTYAIGEWHPSEG